MPYSFYGPNTRSDFLCYFLDMATKVKEVTTVKKVTEVTTVTEGQQ